MSEFTVYVDLYSFLQHLISLIPHSMAIKNLPFSARVCYRKSLLWVIATNSRLHLVTICTVHLLIGSYNITPCMVPLLKSLIEASFNMYRLLITHTPHYRFRMSRNPFPANNLVSAFLGDYGEISSGMGTMPYARLLLCCQ
jgi:hypothetical protein